MEIEEQHQKMILSFKKRYAHGLDTWSNYGYLKETIRVFLDKYQHGGLQTFFEVGIGSCISSEQILENGYRLTGIDVVENKHWSAIKEKWRDQFTATVGDIINISTVDHYDVVLDNGCFHHLEEALYEPALQNMQHLMAPDGILFLSVFKEKDSAAVKGHVELIDGGARRCKFFTADELSELLTNNGFIVEDVFYVSRNFNNEEVMTYICRKKS